MDPKGKVAIVTGGNSGIGLAIATALAQAGSKLVIAARRQERNMAVAEDLARKFGVQTLPVEADVAREADCERRHQHVSGRVRETPDVTQELYDRVLEHK